MSANPEKNNGEELKVDAGLTKNDARNSRLSIGKLRKNNEEVLRTALRNEAQKKCDSYFRAFGECAKQSGLMVVISCREQNRAMSACMDQHFNEDIFKKYLSDHGYPPPQENKSLLDMKNIKKSIFGGEGV